MFTRLRLRRAPADVGSGGNAIAALEKTMLGGAEQWMTMRGCDVGNPVLLFLHGGPGLPEGGSFAAANAELERLFTVVHWEQRGAGLSLSAGMAPGTMTMERLLADLEELVGKLLARFGQSQLYIAGHSWGSLLGLLYAARHPETVRAYVGISQLVDRQEEERRSYALALDAARERGHIRAVRELERIGFPQRSVKDMLRQRKWLTAFGMFACDRRQYGRWARSNLFAPDYSIADIISYVRGMRLSLTRLWQSSLEINLFGQARDVGAPVYLCMGRHDGIASCELAAAFLEQLKAPSKRMTVFEHSAHLPYFEEAKAFNEWMGEIRRNHG